MCIHIYIYSYRCIRTADTLSHLRYNSRRKGSFAAKNHTHAVVPFGWKIFTGILRQSIIAFTVFDRGMGRF